MQNNRLAIRYCLIEQVIENPELGAYTSYAVAILRDDQYTRIVPDVFLDRCKAKEFIERCNLLELDPIHLDDAIEDILGEWCAGQAWAK